MRSGRGEVTKPEPARRVPVGGDRLCGRRTAIDFGVARLATTHAPRTVILPTGDGMRKLPNLTALLAMLLVRFGVPALLHGVPAGDAARGDVARGSRDARSSAVTTADVLSRLGIRAASSVAEVQADLAHELIAYVATDILAPGLAAHRSAPADLPDRMLKKLIDPFGGASYRVVSVDSDACLAPMRAMLAAARADSLLLRGCEGEPFADPRRQVPLEDFRQGVTMVVASRVDGFGRAPPELPASTRASAIAVWIMRVLAGELPVPASIVTQLSCCLIGARRPLSQPTGDVQ